MGNINVVVVRQNAMTTTFQSDSADSVIKTLRAMAKDEKFYMRSAWHSIFICPDGGTMTHLTEPLIDTFLGGAK